MAASIAPHLFELCCSPITYPTRVLYTIFRRITPDRTRTQNAPITVVCLGNTRGHRPDVPHGHIVLHTGSLTKNGTREELQAQIDWLDSLPHQRKFVVPDIHDHALATDTTSRKRRRTPSRASSEPDLDTIDEVPSQENSDSEDEQQAGPQSDHDLDKQDRKEQATEASPKNPDTQQNDANDTSDADGNHKNTAGRNESNSSKLNVRRKGQSEGSTAAGEDSKAGGTANDSSKTPADRETGSKNKRMDSATGDKITTPKGILKKKPKRRFVRSRGKPPAPFNAEDPAFGNKCPYDPYAEAGLHICKLHTDVD